MKKFNVDMKVRKYIEADSVEEAWTIASDDQELAAFMDTHDVIEFRVIDPDLER